MGKWKTIAPIVISIVIAVAGSVFIYKWINLKTAPKEVVKVESEAVPIAVAAVDLQWGTQLKPEMIKTAPFLKESLPEGYFTRTADLNNRVVIASIKKGEPVVEHRLAPISIKTGGVSAVLESGKRAVAVKGDKVIGISGFVNPGKPGRCAGDPQGSQNKIRQNKDRSGKHPGAGHRNPDPEK